MNDKLTENLNMKKYMFCSKTINLGLLFMTLAYPVFHFRIHLIYMISVDLKLQEAGKSLMMASWVELLNLI